MKNTFYVIIFDVNLNIFKQYDILPYLRNCLNRYKNIQTKEELKTFIKNQSKYQWWSRTEYEIILKDWPCGKIEKKIDVYYQVMMNIDIIVNILSKEYKIK